MLHKTATAPRRTGYRRRRGEGRAFRRALRGRAEGRLNADLALAGAARVAALCSIAELSVRVEGHPGRQHLQLCYSHAVGGSGGGGGRARWADGVYLPGCHEEAEPKDSRR